MQHRVLHSNISFTTYPSLSISPKSTYYKQRPAPPPPNEPSHPRKNTSAPAASDRKSTTPSAAPKPKFPPHARDRTQIRRPAPAALASSKPPARERGKRKIHTHATGRIRDTRSSSSSRARLYFPSSGTTLRGLKLRGRARIVTSRAYNRSRARARGWRRRPDSAACILSSTSSPTARRFLCQVPLYSPLLVNYTVRTLRAICPGAPDEEADLSSYLVGETCSRREAGSFRLFIVMCCWDAEYFR